MADILVMRGIPGSGKTTWAKNWVTTDPQYRARICRDDLRSMLHDGLYIQKDKEGSPGTEYIVRRARNELLLSLILANVSVVIDDTNIRRDKDIISIAASLSKDVRLIDLTDVPLETCLERNAAREGKARVPDEVIIHMHNELELWKGHGPIEEGSCFVIPDGSCISPVDCPCGPGLWIQ